jgi:hypothetical protein
MSDRARESKRNVKHQQKGNDRGNSIKVILHGKRKIATKWKRRSRRLITFKLMVRFHPLHNFSPFCSWFSVHFPFARDSDSDSDSDFIECEMIVMAN